MEEFNKHEFNICESPDVKSYYYIIYTNENGDETEREIIKSSETFDYYEECRLAAIGHISMLEKDDYK